jgi:phosphinothricin acetyltransferase
LKVGRRIEIKDILYFEVPGFQTFIINLDNCFCRYIILSEYKKREAYNVSGGVSIYLKGEYPSKGIGSEALNFMEYFAGKNNFHSLVGTISGSNERSIKLFKKTLI